MEEQLKKRPKKTVFKKEEIEKLRDKAVKKVQADFLPNNEIIQILLIGSSVKDSFGKYEPPGFRGSLFSDFDFIIFVDDNFTIPIWLQKEPDGKPFPEDSLNLAYRKKKYVDDKYDAEIFFVRNKSIKDYKIRKLGELAGIPMTENTKHTYQVVYRKNSHTKR